MHKDITREIYPLPEKQSRFLSRLSNNTRRQKKKRERESTVVVALSWSLFAPHHRVCFLCWRVLFGPFLVVKKRPRVCGQYFSIPTVTYIENCDDDDDGRTLFFLGRRDDDSDDAYQTAEKLRRRTV